MIKVKVLDKGFVRLIDVMGDDSSITQAARVSYGAGTKSLREDDRLLRYLMKNEHMSPFEMVELKFHVKLPIFVARQWIRHRTANVNEVSARYSEVSEEFYIPDLPRMKQQGVSNKQGSGDDSIDSPEMGRRLMEEANSEAYRSYKVLLDMGLSREVARTVLPVSTYTEWYWKIDLRNLLHFLRLRLDSHAQEEIQSYAKAIAAIVYGQLPRTYAAFEDLMLGEGK